MFLQDVGTTYQITAQCQNLDSHNMKFVIYVQVFFFIESSLS